jgi:hypothetical protein
MPNYTPPSPTGSFSNIDLSNLSPTNAINVDLNFNSFKGINAANPTNPQDLATKDYVDNSGGGGANLFLSNLVAPVEPNQTFDFGGSNTITGLTSPVNASDASTKDYVDTLIGALAFMNTDFSNALASTIDIDLGTNRLVNVADPINPQDAATKNYVDSGIFANQTLSNLGSTAINADLIFAKGGTGAIIGAANALIADQIRILSGISTINNTSSNIVIETQDSPLGATSGSIDLQTGGGSSSNTLATSGGVSITTGPARGQTGNIVILTGSPDAGNSTSGTPQSGSLTLATGLVTDNKTSGAILLSSGSSTSGTGSSGLVDLATGGKSGVTSGTTGEMRLRSGNAIATNSNSGNVAISTGTATNQSGNIVLTVGNATTTRGKIQMSGVVQLQSRNADPVAADAGGSVLGGMIYYNSVTGKFRGYNAVLATWEDLN